MILWWLVEMKEPFYDEKDFNVKVASMFFTKWCYHFQINIININLVGEQYLRPTIPQNIPLNLKILMSKCWLHDPTKRPAFDEIMERFVRTCNCCARFMFFIRVTDVISADYATVPNLFWNEHFIRSQVRQQKITV